MQICRVASFLSLKQLLGEMLSRAIPINPKKFMANILAICSYYAFWSNYDRLIISNFYAVKSIEVGKVNMVKKNNKSESFEKTLFKTADKLHKNMDAAEYKHIALGLIFLKYISDSFEALPRAKQLSNIGFKLE